MAPPADVTLSPFENVGKLKVIVVCANALSGTTPSTSKTAITLISPINPLDFTEKILLLNIIHFMKKLI